MKIFWDTNLFIYLWERKSCVEEMAALTAFMESGRHILATSTLTLGEILVQPCRIERPDLVTKYREAFERLLLIPFEREGAVYFANLRAANPALRPPDAIQLACAVTGGCELFLTNDDRLASLTPTSGMKVQSLGQWCANHP